MQALTFILYIKFIRSVAVVIYRFTGIQFFLSLNLWLICYLSIKWLSDWLSLINLLLIVVKVFIVTLSLGYFNFSFITFFNHTFTANNCHYDHKYKNNAQRNSNRKTKNQIFVIFPILQAINIICQTSFISPHITKNVI